MEHSSRSVCLRVAAVTVLALLLMDITSAAAAEPGYADSVLGRWDLTVQGQDGEYPSWFEIRLRTERELMAGFVGRFGSMRHASAVRFSDDALEVRIPPQYETGDDELVFTGTLTDGQLAGSVRTSDGETLAWTGVRAPALVRTGVQRWGEPVELLADGLSRWRQRSDQHPGCWTVQDDVLQATPPCVDLITEARFDDFRLQLEFRYPSGSNSGVYLRGRYEVQIQDDRGKAVDPLRIGGLYGFIAPSENAARAPDEWQTMDITLSGRRLTVLLNDIEIISNREIPGITGGALDSDEGSAGPLMLQGDHGPVEFRNIVLTPAR